MECDDAHARACDLIFVPTGISETREALVSRLVLTADELRSLVDAEPNNDRYVASRIVRGLKAQAPYRDGFFGK